MDARHAARGDRTSGLHRSRGEKEAEPPGGRRPWPNLSPRAGGRTAARRWPARRGCSSDARAMRCGRCRRGGGNPRIGCCSKRNRPRHGRRSKRWRRTTPHRWRGCGRFGCCRHGAGSGMTPLMLALKSASPGVRSVALRLAESHPVERLSREVLAATDDPIPSVRLQAALSTGALAVAGRVEPLLRMVRRDAGDPWLVKAALIGLGTEAPVALASGAGRTAPPRCRNLRSNRWPGWPSPLDGHCRRSIKRRSPPALASGLAAGATAAAAGEDDAWRGRLEKWAATAARVGATGAFRSGRRLGGAGAGRARFRTGQGRPGRAGRRPARDRSRQGRRSAGPRTGRRPVGTAA